VRDPRVQEITITEVEVTGDLQIATIYYTTLHKLASERQATERGLEKSKGLIRRELGKRLSLYKTPELIFKFFILYSLFKNKSNSSYSLNKFSFIRSVSLR